ncbi:putative metallophosphoesterase [Clostridium homopropionicum DSM 5847]|uniref:Putative metallophosphoesterase n=1 Tax=Clostridium homopropionicum DSM 5847 TaxID=1121318 RepID=A0A0L6Z5P3_9CLOT|nr:metallophosphoesterase [Clostridium homopropionicum]KOA18285.1 putative metallophosphoesterase [Clostridium homopropionicum DSM 5847]SFF69805.1 hypothetical protein SAMN04488501_101302 [Clostridium homopropionicum]
MKNKFILLVTIIIAIFMFIYVENNFLEINKLEVMSNRIPASFNGYKIVHLSDLHNKTFGKNQKQLVDKIQKLKPDIIVFTGDIVDIRRYNEEPSILLIERLSKIAPVYYVPGNHEIGSGKLKNLQLRLEKAGAIVLRNESVRITKNKEQILISGIDDPNAVKGNKNENEKIQSEINLTYKEEFKDNYRILLSHRPEKLSVYAKNKFDLVFSGHAHGGQVRIPFIGGLIAPQQGFFPKYTSGKYIKESTVMIVSRGLGNSKAPVRVFNRPEIILTTLNKTN